MNGDVSIDIGDALPYYTEKLLGWFGQDAATRAANERFVRIQRMGVERASCIQCIGMPDPVPIKRLYQPSRLSPQTTLDNLVRGRESTVITAGPGRGKTTLLHWIFVSMLRNDTVLPLLFTLRLPSAVQDLTDLIVHLKDKTKLKGLKDKLLLLIDGYDEINEAERKNVSELLTEYKTLNRGAFILTCRSYYPVPDVHAARFEIAPFQMEDSVRFVATFSDALGLGASIDGASFCKELVDRGFDDFVGHPLMLLRSV